MTYKWGGECGKPENCHPELGSWEMEMEVGGRRCQVAAAATRPGGDGRGVENRKTATQRILEERPVHPAGQRAHANDQGDEHDGLLCAQHGANDEHVRQRQGRTGQQQGERGPLPMPLSISPWRMGTSVSVATYMKAPATEANRFAPGSRNGSFRSRSSCGDLRRAACGVAQVATRLATRPRQELAASPFRCPPFRCPRAHLLCARFATPPT
jgi:hypothetical protein